MAELPSRAKRGVPTPARSAGAERKLGIRIPPSLRSEDAQASPRSPSGAEGIKPLRAGREIEDGIRYFHPLIGNPGKEVRDMGYRVPSVQQATRVRVSLLRGNFFR